MRKKDTNSIAYLFKEMDPSEEVEFERNLNDNNNLLIEVESFKQINDRLKSLPTLNPPEDVVQSIHELAAAKSSNPAGNLYNPVYYAAAAAVLISFMAGVLLLDFNESSDGTENASFANPAFEMPQSTIYGVSSSENSERALTPWIDKNEVIRFSDRISQTESSSVDSIFKNSYQKLTPVTNPLQSGMYQRNIHLTGSRP